MSTFEFERSVKVTHLDIRWDLLWIMEDESPEFGKVLSDANDSLTRAAIAALENKNYQLWFDVADALANLGAADIEPIWQFRNLWHQAYGEDI